MRTKSFTFLSTLLACVVCGMLLAAAPVFAQPELSIDDCAKCHEQQPAEVAEAGAKHKTDTDCLGCHTGHRPSSPANIPECSMCHEGTPHYELANCMSCHNPHQPLRVVLQGDLKAECLTCHTEQNAELVANPSKHTDVACNLCHSDTHGNIPQCSECHQSHAETQTQNDCAICHDVHKPMVLEYPDTTPNIHCAACHDTAYDLLMATKTKHRDVACVACHANKHRTVPACSDCHDLPHAEGIHEKFPKCGSCHNTAHDLNNFAGK